MPVLTVLVVVLALLFAAERSRVLRPVFRLVPVLVFCYFVPTALSNTGVIPGGAPAAGEPDFPLYPFVMDWLLPASLLLLVLAVDVLGIVRLGARAVLLFGAAVASIVLGGPLAYLLLGWAFDAEQGEQVWRGLAALSGSWIGGGANFAAIGRNVGISAEMLGVMVVVDVMVLNVWMVVLLYLAARHRELDARLGADTRTVDEVERRATDEARAVAAPTDLPALLAILALGFGGTYASDLLATSIHGWLRASLAPDHWLFDVFGRYAWKILAVTFLGVALSFTPARRLEGRGASRLGMLFLYLLIGSIGAQADFARVFTFANLPLLAVAAVWMAFHAAVILGVRRLARAPVFFAAVGSTACIGGTASTSIVAAAFSPGLAPVGVLLAIGGYVLGTLGGLACAFLLRLVNGLWHG
ncbi:MAG: DUF819 family protein [Planctomycetes bacterium]|nr:DUF819 family protein [Planctomycetota bacterium]